MLMVIPLSFNRWTLFCEGTQLAVGEWWMAAGGLAFVVCGSWFVARGLWLMVGSHAVFTHPSKNGRVVVPMHPGDIPKGTLNDRLKRAGMKK